MSSNAVEIRRSGLEELIPTPVRVFADHKNVFSFIVNFDDFTVERPKRKLPSGQSCTVLGRMKFLDRLRDYHTLAKFPLSE